MVPLCFALPSRKAPFGLQQVHSDITVAPVVPTEGSTHCSQNELQTKSCHCLAPTGNSLRRFLPYSFCSNALSYRTYAYVIKKIHICQAFYRINLTVCQYLQFFVQLFQMACFSPVWVVKCRKICWRFDYEGFAFW